MASSCASRPPDVRVYLGRRFSGISFEGVASFRPATALRGLCVQKRALALKHASLIALIVLMAAFVSPGANADLAPTSPPAEAAEPPGLLFSAWDWFHKGGPIMYPIAFISLVGLAFVIERAVALRRKNALPEHLREELTQRLDALDVAGAIALAEETPCSLARIIKPALLRQSGTIQEMERAAEEAGVRELWQLRRNVRPIGIVASISPLLGLLGTVLGMIGAFRTMATGDTMGNPNAFANDIYEALLTTLFGLSVAIPMLVCHAWLHGKAEAIISEIEEVAGDLLLRLRGRKMQHETAELQVARSE